MAIHTALALLLLCIGLILSRPHWGLMRTIVSPAPGGVMARRLLPAALLIPVSLGWLRWMGQLLGWYEAPFGVALFTSASVVVFGLFMCWGAEKLNGLDAVRSGIERHLHASEGQFRALLESAPDAMVISGEDRRIVLVNARAESLFGYPRIEILGGTLEKLILRGAGPMDFQGIGKDGDRFPVEISLSAIPTSRGALAAASIRDVRERKRMDGQLRESELRHRTLLESLPQMVWTLNADGICDYISPQWMAYTGQAASARPDTAGEAALHPDDLPPVAENMAAALRAGSRFQAECRIRNASGEYRWFQTAAIPLRDSDGAIAKWLGVSSDIHDRKLAEAALRGSESSLRQLADCMPQIVWTANAASEADYFNRRAYDYLGMTFEETRDGGWVSSIHPNERENVMEGRKRAFACREPYVLEYRFKRASDGMYRWQLARGTPAFDSEGNLTRWIGTCTDIHDLKQTEVALRSSEAVFQQLADSMPQIVWMAKPDGNLDYFNRRWYEFTGMTFEQTKDWGWESVLHPDDLQNCIDRWTHAFTAGQPFEGEYRFKRASGGGYRWHLGRALPVLNSEGRVVRWFGTCTDIEDYKQAEASIANRNESLESSMLERTAELRESEERFRSFVEEVKDYALLSLDRQGRVATWSAGAARMKGYATEEIVGRHFSCFYSAEDIEKGHPQEVLRKAAASGYFNEEGWRIRRDGSRFWADVMITAVLDSAGRVQSFSKVTHDITERRRAQEQLVAESARAEAANRAKSAFLAAMSHEIRTPMNAILGMAELLWDTHLDAQQREYVGVFQSAGSCLLTLINDILDLSKIEAGNLELERIEFDLEEVVDQAVELTGGKARAKGLVLLSRMPPGVSTALVGDPARLRQILINLLGNAVKFTESGRVLLTVENHESGLPGMLEFSVSDTGIGIAPDKLETIFQDFTQADASTTRKYGGTGLGLGICRRIVESMGGRLVAISSPGEGSTFRFAAQFQLASPKIGNLLVGDAIKSRVRLELESQAPKSTDMGTAEPVRPLRILVADDAPFNRLVVEAFLKGGPYVLTFAENGQAAADLFAAGEFDLVLMDMQMPVMDGLTATRAIREIERAKGAARTPVIAVTANAQPEYVEMSRGAGCDSHLSKPVSKLTLLSAVDRYATRSVDRVVA